MDKEGMHTMVISEFCPPPIEGSAPPVHGYERGLDPFHEDAFPVELREVAPGKGRRNAGWFVLDGCGNVIGFIPDGTVIKCRHKTRGFHGPRGDKDFTATDR
jgi:hypothetical protein